MCSAAWAITLATPNMFSKNKGLTKALLGIESKWVHRIFSGFFVLRGNTDPLTPQNFTNLRALGTTVMLNEKEKALSRNASSFTVPLSMHAHLIKDHHQLNKAVRQFGI